MPCSALRPASRERRRRSAGVRAKACYSCRGGKPADEGYGALLCLRPARLLIIGARPVKGTLSGCRRGKSSGLSVAFLHAINNIMNFTRNNTYSS
ncbi:hypothetical protein DPQ22_05795 [Candidatus Tokpelaia sp.]|nr:hypothetical protein DPQ22_05795 [Candidatus Tokpelaia sp.]